MAIVRKYTDKGRSFSPSYYVILQSNLDLVASKKLKYHVISIYVRESESGNNQITVLAKKGKDKTYPLTFENKKEALDVMDIIVFVAEDIGQFKSKGEKNGR